MLSQLEAQPADALLALIKLHRDDPREDKIDLGVGVYRTDDGATPVFGAIKAAERRLLEQQDSKAYLGPDGDLGFVAALMPYVFGASDPDRGGRIAGVQTPGGTGAVRLALALAKKAGVRRVLLGKPSWPNHAQIIADLGLETVTFDHAQADGTANLAALEQAMAGAGGETALLLHGCCHNPTGIDYSPDQWRSIAAALVSSGALPIIDVAYQGLGEGMAEDAAGLTIVLDAVPEALVAYSCDKNFGLYRDRVGALYVMAQAASNLPAILSNIVAFARASWSMPPDHGAAAVRLVLEDPALTRQWQNELTAMRARMRAMRERLAAGDNEVAGMNLAPLARQHGLFAMLPLSPAQVERLRADHAVYMAGSGRINVAGLTSHNIDRFIAALAAVAA